MKVATTKINRKRTLIGVILNFAIVIMTIIAMIWQIVFRGDSGPLGDFGNGFGSLYAFTNESNILCAVIALALACIGIRNLVRKEYNFSHGWRVLQLIGATVVFLTFAVVVTFLNPLFTIKTGNLLALFSESMFFTHFLTPVLAVIVFIFFTPSKAQFKTRDNFLVLIPIIVYGIVYLINVVVLGVWPDFYNFTFGGQIQFVPLVFVVILVGSFGLARLLIMAQKKYKCKLAFL